jgi:hypothetical protein
MQATHSETLPKVRYSCTSSRKREENIFGQCVQKTSDKCRYTREGNEPKRSLPMDHKATAPEALKVLDDHGAATLGEKAAAEVLSLKASLTPTQYKELFKAAEVTAMLAFPVIGITWAAEQAGEKIMKHK